MWEKFDTYCVCKLCSHFCRLSEEEPVGKCNVRCYKDGGLFSLVDKRLAAVNIDPIEKKPLYHFKPKAKALSVGTVGCNFQCAWCQNHALVTAVQAVNFPEHDIHTMSVCFGQAYEPEELIRIACEHNVETLAYTYNEPTIFFEQLLPLAERAIRENKANVFVSNGYFSKQAFQVLKQYIHAFNIDIKAYSEKAYQDFCGARLRPVLDSCVRVKEAGLHLEVTTLLIPELNDSTEELMRLAQFIAEKLGKDTVWHISAFHPSHTMRNKAATPVHTLDKAYEIGKEAGLHYIYYGNVPKANNTVCPKCQTILIKRKGYSVEILDDFRGKCPRCDFEINGIWRYYE